MATTATHSHVLTKRGLPALLATLWREKEPLLDLSDYEAIENPAGSLLSAFLLGPLGDRALVIRERKRESGSMAPRPSEKIWELAFAIAHRHGETRLEGFDDPRALLKPWHRSWRSGDPDPWARLFPRQGDLFDDDECLQPIPLPDAFSAGSGYAAFVNPHLSTTTNSRVDLPDQAACWLDRLLPASGEGRESVARSVQQVLGELLQNVMEWGAGPSLVQIRVTRGERTRVWLSILDSGKGIAATARGKVPAKVGSDSDLLEGLFSGDIELPHERGFGLPGLHRFISESMGNEFWCFTAGHEVHSFGGKLSVTRTEFPMQGTVAAVKLLCP